jgi:hypothetical protein
MKLTSNTEDQDGWKDNNLALEVPDCIAAEKLDGNFYQTSAPD